MNDDMLLMARRVLTEREFVDGPDNGFNVIDMRRECGSDLAILVWAHEWDEVLYIQAANPSDYDAVCSIAEISQESDLIAIIDALVQAFQVVARFDTIQSES